MPPKQNDKANQEFNEKQQFNCVSLNIDYAVTYDSRSFFSTLYSINDENDLAMLLSDTTTFVPAPVVKAYISYVQKTIGSNALIVFNSNSKSSCPLQVVSTVKPLDAEDTVFISAYPHLTCPNTDVSAALAGSQWHITDMFNHVDALSEDHMEYQLTHDLSNSNYKVLVKDRARVTIDSKTGAIGKPTREDLAAIIMQDNETAFSNQLYQTYSVSLGHGKISRNENLDSKDEHKKFKQTRLLHINNLQPERDKEKIAVLSPSRSAHRKRCI